MLKNAFTMTLRIMRANLLSAGLNIFGLSLGLSACILSWLYIAHETAYDSFYSNSENVIRVSRSIEYGEGNIQHAPGAPALLAPLLEPQVSGIDTVTRYWPTNGTALVQVGGENYNELGVAQADKNFFDVFNIPFLLGNPQTVLDGPSKVVLSESLAQKYFGSAASAMGKTINVYRRGDVVVSGVYLDLPQTSHLEYSLIVSMDTTPSDFWMFGFWDIDFFHTYILAEPGFEIKTIQDQLDAVAQQIPADEEGGTSRLTAWPVQDIHLYSDMAGELRPHNAAAAIGRFISVSLLMILTASVNHINMATAIGALRAKEIAVRQVVGGTKVGIILQFLTEAFATTMVALLFALMMLELGIGSLNAVLGTNILLSGLLSGPSLVALFAILAGVTLLAGMYPAILFSRIRPGIVLRGARGARVKHHMRYILVILQFSIASILVLAISVVAHQNYFMDNLPRGYNSENLVVLANLDDAELNVEVLKQELLNHSEIVSVGASTNIPTSYLSHATTYQSPEQSSEVALTGLNIDVGFFETFGIEIKAGRNFSLDRGGDDVNGLSEGENQQRIILNETAVRRFGWALEEAIGKVIIRDDLQMEIIGVVADVHFGSLREPLIPVSYQFNSAEYNYLSIKVTDINQLSTLDYIDNTALGLSETGQPPLRNTIAERYDNLYADEQNQQRVLTFLSGLVVVIAGLGIFALASFIMKNRALEIAIRKILGARSDQIARLMLLSFAKVALFANVIAFPIAAVVMSNWLAQYQYRIDFGAVHVLVAVCLTVSLALLATFGQSMRLSRKHPIDALKQI